MLETIDTVVHYARALWRYRWQSMLIAWIVCILGWAAIMRVPDVYESSARVYVDTRTALRPMLEGIAVDQDVESDLFRVRQALLSRPQLQKVAEETGLYARAKNKSQQFALIENLRNGISITSDSRNTDSVYTISYRNADRGMSLAVVQLLVKTFVADTIGGKQAGSDAAQSFLRDQLQGYQIRLAKSEENLAKFKRDKLGLLPGAGGDYFTRLNTEMAAEKQAEASLAIAYGRRAELARQLGRSHPYVPGTTAPAGATGATNAPPSDITARRLEAETKLQDLLLRFTEKHPEVIALQAQIAELKQREQAELHDISNGGEGTGAIRSLSANPVYQNIQTQLNQADVEISALNAAVSQHKAEVANLRKVVDTAPAVEQEFAELNRDYEVTKAQYTALLQRLERARVTDDAGRDGIMKFEVMDPAATSPQPVSPKRLLLVLGMLVVGLGAGIAWGILRQIVQPTFTSAQSLAHATGLQVVGVISAAVSAAERSRHRADTWRVAFTTMTLVGASVALAVTSGTVYQLVQGLFD
jgi:protein tyrosine kinase modulator